MPSKMVLPQNKLTLDSVEFPNIITNMKITCNENGFDIANFTLPDTSYYPSDVTNDSTIQFDVKDASDGAYTTQFKGVVRFLTADVSESQPRSLNLVCDGAGCGFGEMLVAMEYGSQSMNPTLDQVDEIINDIVGNHVNKYLNSGNSSNYNYTILNTITNSIPFINFAYKPALAALNDIIDLVSAQEAGDPGIHWIVTTDDILHVKALDASQTGWTKYYGNSQANATLTYGSDYSHINIEKLGAEGNYIIYYGSWRRPSNGDGWTEDITGWGSGDKVSLSKDSTNYAVGTASLKATQLGSGSDYTWYYPSGKNAAWDFTKIGSYKYIPTLNFSMSYHDVSAVNVYIATDASYSYVLPMENSILGIDRCEGEDHFKRFSIPIGPYWRTAPNNFKWTPVISNQPPDWSEINYVAFSIVGDPDCTVNVDGFYIGDVPLCRVAWNSTFPSGYMKMRLITDDQGKDDSLIESDDSGLMAQLAYAELLRQQKESRVGTIECPMIKDILPGQLVYVQSVDYRVTKIEHLLSPTEGYKTKLYVTDDVTNSRARLRYEDLNKQYASLRPEFQDRQASNIKAGQVDWQVPRLETDYG